VEEANDELHTHTQKALLLLILIILIVGSARTATAVPTQWLVIDGGNGHYYEGVIVPDGISWADAKVAAENRGGYLATIHAQAENDFIYNLISAYEYWHGPSKPIDSFTGPWLGGMQMPGSVEPAGGWTWVTGEPWTYTNWHLNWGGVDLPDNADNADKLHFIQQWSSITQPTPYWDDLSDIPSGSQYPVVAYVVEYVPEPSTAGLFVLGGVLAILFTRRNLL
jgi:hypothetical protein